MSDYTTPSGSLADCSGSQDNRAVHICLQYIQNHEHITIHWCACFSDSIFRWTKANRQSDSLGYYMHEYAGQTHCKLFPMTLAPLESEGF